MRSLKLALIQNDECPCKKGEWRQVHTVRMSCRHQGRDGSDVPSSQEIPDCPKTNKLGESHRINSPSEPSERTNPRDTLISGIFLQTDSNKILCLSNIVDYTTCYGSNIVSGSHTQICNSASPKVVCQWY
jgi:hypothetical protein